MRDQEWPVSSVDWTNSYWPSATRQRPSANDHQPTTISY